MRMRSGWIAVFAVTALFVLARTAAGAALSSGEAAGYLERTWTADGIVMLDFEGLQNDEPVQNFYSGGTGGYGSGPGPNYGIYFSNNALALIDADQGGTGNFGGEPSPDTILYWLSGAAATLNVPAGFDTGFSFFYSAIVYTGSITVYDGLNATGNVLATLALPLTPFNGAPDPTGQYSPFIPIGVAFTGTAMSIDFGGTANYIGFDNITFGSDVPDTGVIPEPATLALLGIGLAGLGLSRRRKR